MSGAIEPRLFQALVVAKALEMYARFGIKANSAYTPANMMRTATRITGRTFNARDYEGAARALRKWVNEEATT